VCSSDLIGVAAAVAARPDGFTVTAASEEVHAAVDVTSVVFPSDQVAVACNWSVFPATSLGAEGPIAMAWITGVPPPP
jgi:hypothetical protein